MHDLVRSLHFLNNNLPTTVPTIIATTISTATTMPIIAAVPKPDCLLGSEVGSENMIKIIQSSITLSLSLSSQQLLAKASQI